MRTAPEVRQPAGRRPASAVDATFDTSVGDGRAARRARNRVAVLDAAYELVESGNPQPSFEDVALASGISLSSVYRYFSSQEELIQATVERRVERFKELFAIPDPGEGTLEERLDVLVQQRLALWEAVGAAVPVIMRLASSCESLEAIADERRRTLRRQLEIQFSPELGAMDSQTRSEVLAAADALCQFEGIQYLREIQKLSAAKIHRTLVGALRRLLSTQEPAAPASSRRRVTTGQRTAASGKRKTTTGR